MSNPSKTVQSKNTSTANHEQRTTNSLLKIGEAAKILGVSIDTLRRWEKSNKISAIRTPGGTRLYSLNSLKKLNPHIAKASTEEINPISTEELLKRTEATSFFSTPAAPVFPLIQITSDAESEVNIQPRSKKTSQTDSKKLSLVTRFFLIGSVVLSIITLVITSWITASYLTHPKEAELFFKSNVASDLFKPFQFLAEETISVINPKKAKELGFSKPEPPPLATNYRLRTTNSNVLAVTSTSPFLEVNADTQINGSLFVRDDINGLVMEATPSAGTLALTAGNTTLTVTKTAKLDQDVSTAGSPSFASLTVPSTKDQLKLSSGTLTWTPTTTRTITLPDATGTVVLDSAAQTLTNKTISGASNTFSNIPVSAITGGGSFTINAGTNLSGGGALTFGGSVSLSLKDAVGLTDGTAAAPSYSFSSDTDSGLYRLSANTIGLITGGSATKGITIDSSGNVGIGTITPGYTLDVTGTQRITSNATIGGTLGVTGATTLASTLGVTGATTLSSTLSVGSYATIGSAFAGSVSPTNGLAIYGNVGIGTTSTSNALEVVGSINLSSGQVYKIGGSQISLNSLSGVSTTSPSSNQVLTYNGSEWVNANANQVSASNGVVFYLDDTASDIPTYLSIPRSPGTDTEQTGSAIVNNNTVSIATFASASSGIGGTQIDAGAWQFYTYNYVSATDGVSKIAIDVYKRTSGGTETLLFSTDTGELNNTTNALNNITTVQPAFAIDPTDRLVVKYSATTTNTSNTTISMTYDGTDHYSHIRTPLVTRHNDLSGLQGGTGIGTSGEYYHLTSSEYTGSGTGVFARVTSPTFGGNVGIGATAPNTALNVIGNIGIGTTGTGASLTVNGNGVIGWGTSAVTGPTNGLAVSGNVGIGTTSPNALLQVIGNINATTFNGLSITNNGSNTLNIASGKTLTVNNSLTFAGTDSTTMTFPSASDTVAGLGTTQTFTGVNTFNGNVLFGGSTGILQSNGNVGIGTTAPGSPFTLTSAQATGNIASLTANSLSTGNLMNLSSTSTSLSSGGLLNLDWSPTGSSTIYATGDLFSINVGQYGSVGNLFNLKDNGSSIFSVSQTSVTTSLPTAFNAPGDVSIAYDLNFTNPTASYIKSGAPLYIQAGKVYNSSDLTLRTFNSGQVVLDAAGGVTLNQYQPWTLASSTMAWNIIDSSSNTLMSFDTTNDRVGIGKSGPYSKFQITGAGTSTGLTFLTTDSSGTQRFAVLDNGNVGIGITAPGSALQLSGDAVIGFGGATSIAGPSNGLAVSGNIGIGTTSPNQKLTIISSGNSTTPFQINNSNGNSLVSAYQSSTGTGALYLANATGATLIQLNAAGNSYFTNNVGIGNSAPNTGLNVASNAVIGFGTTTANIAGPSSGLAVSGNVGIGTTTAGSNLTVVGTSNISGNATFGGQILGANGSASAPSHSFTNLTNAGLWTNGDGLLLTTGGSNTSGIAITANGNVGISTTAPSYKFDLSSTSATGSDFRIANNSLNTGNMAYLSSTSTALTTGGLLSLDWSPTGSSTIYATGDLFSINVGQYGSVGNIFNLKDNGSSIFSVSQTSVTTSLPAAFNAAGDVSVAYDLNFTNPTSSNIKSQAPISITAGETFNSSDLSLNTYNAGSTIISQNNQPTAAGTAYALQITPSLTSSTNSLTYTAQYGTYSVPTVNLSGTSGTVTSLYNNYQGLTATAGTVTNWYGYYAAAPTGSGTVTNKYAFISESGAGNVGIGTTGPSSLFAVGSSSQFQVNSSGNVTFAATLTPTSNFTLGSASYTGTLTTSDWAISSAGALTGISGITNDGAYTQSGSSANTFTGNVLFGGSTGILQSNGNVGIGTTAPGSMFQLSGNAVIGFGGVTSIAGPSNGLAVSGNVGIGTTSPGKTLDVNGDIRLANTGNLYLHSNGYNFINYNSWQGDGSSGLSIIERLASPILFYTGGNTSAYERMRIDAAGNVGIGTTGPARKLEVNGALRLDSTSEPGSAALGDIYTSATNKLYFYNGSVWVDLTAAATGSVPSGDLAGQTLYYNGAAWALTTNIFNDNTNVGIGLSNPSEKLDVNGRIAIRQTTAPVTTTDKLYNVSGSLYWNGTNISGGNITPGSTTGQTLYWNGAAWTPDLNLFSNGTNVGIGTTGAGSTLAINGNTVIGYGGAAAIAGPANGLAINGNVGIGTTSPAFKLDVTGEISSGVAGGAAGKLTLQVVSNSETAPYITSNTLGYLDLEAPTGWMVYNPRDGHQFQINGTPVAHITASTLDFQQANSITTPVNTNLTLSNTGTGNIILSPGANVGIGTASPVAQLDVRNTNASTGLHTYIGSSAGQFVILDNGNVGIGTTAPSSALNIIGNVGIGTSAAGATVAINGNEIIGWGTTSIAGPTKGLAVKGNVGIGTTSPSAVLDVVGSTDNNLFKLRTSAGTTLLDFNSTGGNPYLNLYSTDSISKVHLDSNATSYFWGGNVGIGTTGAGSNLTVVGTSNISGNATFGGQILGANGSASLPSYSFTNLTNAGLWTNGDGLLLTTGGSNTSGIAITANGNVGIGTTAPGAYKLNVNGIANVGSQLNIDLTPSLVSASTSLRVGSSSSWSDGIAIYGGANEVARFVSGNVGIGTTTPGSKLAVVGGSTIGYGSTGSSPAAPSNGLAVSGNVGIGTTSPSQALDVIGAVRLGAGGTNNVLNTSAAEGAATGPVYWGNKALSYAINIAGINGTPVTVSNVETIQFDQDTGLHVTDMGSNIAKISIGSHWYTIFVNGVSSLTPTGEENINFVTGNNLTITANSGASPQSLTFAVSPAVTFDTVTTSGNVGIGTTTPQSLLDVNMKFNVFSGGNVGIGTTAPGNFLLNVAGDTKIGDGSQLVLGSKADPDPSGSNGSMYYNTTSNKFRCYQNGGWADCGKSSAWSAIENPAGNLSLSMGANTSTFTFNGATGADTNLFNLADTAGNSGTGYLLNLATAPGSTLKPLDITAAGVQSLSVNSNGNVGIGTTAPTANFQVTGNALIGYSSAVGAPANGMAVSGNVGVGTTSPAWKFQVVVSPAYEGHVDDVGSWSRTSDIRMKTNINTLSSALDNVLQLRPVTYDPITATNIEPGLGQNIGFIAQEMENIYPQFVDTDSTGRKSISYESLTPVLTKAIQELNTKVDNFQNPLAALSLDSEGNLIVPKLKTGSIILDESLTSASVQLTSNPIDVTGQMLTMQQNIQNHETRIETLEAKVAALEAASAQMIQTATSSASPTSEVNESTASASTSEVSTSLSLTPPDILLATGSATLANLTVASEATVSGQLTAYNLNVQNSLKALGKTTLADTSIAGDLNVDGTLSVENGSEINVVGTLYLQKSLLAGNLNIFDGRVTIDTQGNIQTSGIITASQVETNKLTIINSHPELDSGSNILGTSIGTSTLPAGTTSVTIDTTQVSDTAKIFVTPITATDKVLSVANIRSGQSFDVKILTPTSTDIKFNWWLVETK